VSYYEQQSQEHIQKSNYRGVLQGISRVIGVSILKHIKMGVIALLLIGMVIALTGIACADQPVPAVPETQSLITGTTADVVGLATETDAGAWTLTNDPLVLYTYNNNPGYGVQFPVSQYNSMLAQLQSAGGSAQAIPAGPSFVLLTQLNIPQSLLNTVMAGSTDTYQKFLDDNSDKYNGPIITGNGIHTGVLDPGQVQYTTAYDASIVGQAGHTVLVKSMNIDTRNKVISQSNLNAKTALTFIATADGGNVVGSENLLIDGAGMNTTASDRMLCPFAAGTTNVIPAYCNIVQAGSKYDLTVGSVTTNANDRFVGTDATNPVVLNYDINVKPYGTTAGQIPAIGSASAYIKAHIQEARGNATVRNEDLTYNEQSSAQGTITSFQKVIAYQSGKALL
jgi:hypothetical protein